MLPKKNVLNLLTKGHVGLVNRENEKEKKRVTERKKIQREKAFKKKDKLHKRKKERTRSRVDQ